MKIAIIGQKGIPVSSGGGVEKHVQELSWRLAEDYEVIAYTRPHYTPKQTRYYQRVRLVSLPSVTTKHADAISHTFLAICHAAIREKVDIFHIHSVGPALLAWLPRLLRPSAKVITTFHSIDRQHQKWNRFAKFMLLIGEWSAMKFSHEVITVSKSLQNYSYELYHRLPVYIPNGVAQMPIQKASAIKQLYNLSADSYIVVISRLVRHKGIHYLIKAYQQLNTEKKLVIVGGSVHTDNYVAELKALADNDPNIIFTGDQTGHVLAELYSNAYLHVLPSEFEGLSLSLLEAAAYGKTILVSDIAANLEIVEQSGCSFKNRDVIDLRDKLNYLLAKPELVKTIGQKARSFVLQNYHWDSITAQTSRLYRQLYVVQPRLVSRATSRLV